MTCWSVLLPEQETFQPQLQQADACAVMFEKQVDSPLLPGRMNPQQNWDKPTSVGAWTCLEPVSTHPFNEVS